MNVFDVRSTIGPLEKILSCQVMRGAAAFAKSKTTLAQFSPGFFKLLFLQIVLIRFNVSVSERKNQRERIREKEDQRGRYRKT